MGSPSPRGDKVANVAIVAVSQASQLHSELLGWTPLQIDFFEERAAILEYDAGLPREFAEFVASGLVGLSRERR